MAAPDPNLPQIGRVPVRSAAGDAQAGVSAGLRLLRHRTPRARDLGTSTPGRVSPSDWYRSLAVATSSTSTRGRPLDRQPRTRAEQRIAAAVLAAGPGAMASHRSAAFLFGAPRPDEDQVDIFVVDRRRRPVVDGCAIAPPRSQGPVAGTQANIPTCNILRWRCDLGAVDEPSVNQPSAMSSAGGWRHRGRCAPQSRSTPAADGLGVPALRARARRLGARRQAGRQHPRADDAPAQRFGLPPAQFHAIVAGYEVDFHFLGRWSSWNATDGRRTAATATSSSSIGSARGVTAAGSSSCTSPIGSTRQPERVAKRIRANLDPNLTA